MVGVDYSSLQADSDIVVVVIIIIIIIIITLCLPLTNKTSSDILQLSAIQRLDSNHSEHALQI